MGGSLGGFDGDHFIYHLGAKAVSHGDRTLRDFADAGLQGAWPALTYELPALAQRFGGEGLLSEAVFVTSMIALSLVVLFVTAAELTSSFSALVVTVLTLFASTKLYAYPKVFVFAVAVALLLRYTRKPTDQYVVLLSIWSAIAFLFRHDFLVYLAPSVTILIIALGPLRRVVKHLVMYGAVLTLLLAGPLYSVYRYVGLTSYVETSLALIAREGARTDVGWPRFERTDVDVLGFIQKEENAEAWLYYLSFAVPWLALLALLGSPHSGQLGARQTRAVVVSLVVLAVLLHWFLLRNNLAGRLGDLGAPVAILAAWLSVRWRGAALSTRFVAWTVTVLILVVTVLALSTTGSVWRELDTTGFRDSVQQIGSRIRTVTTDLGTLPPGDGAPLDPRPNAAEYIRVCIDADDRVLLMTDSPEILAIGGRMFAAGQPTLRSGFYTLDSDQRVMLKRLASEVVPVVLIGQDYADNYASEFPLVHEHISGEYALAGELPALAGNPLRILIHRGRASNTTYRSTGVPCFR